MRSIAECQYLRQAMLDIVAPVFVEMSASSEKGIGKIAGESLLILVERSFNALVWRSIHSSSLCHDFPSNTRKGLFGSLV